MDKTEDIKVDALLTVAKAFFDRGKAIQYDELSMDRICCITPRRELYSVPEKATNQHILFLDCSSFVFSTFYQAFGYSFEANVTSDMINLSNIRVFYYEIIGNETDAKKFSIIEDFKNILQAGDVIVIVCNNNGHTMLYAGNDIFYHCSSNGKEGSYNYQQRHDNICDSGAIYCINSSAIFSPKINGIPSRNYLFKYTNRAFCILRPLSRVDAITSETQKRMRGLKDIYVAVTCTHPEGRSIRLGEEITYNVKVSNVDTFERNIKINYEKTEISFNLDVGDSIVKSYTEIIKKDMVDKQYIHTPKITVNDVEIYVPLVIFDNNHYFSKFSLLTPELILNDLFERQTVTEGEVYYLRENTQFISMLVTSHFGGFGVISPEIVDLSDIRIHRITMSSLQPGDLIVYKDSIDKAAVGVKYYGDGVFDYAVDTDPYAFIDSLFGRFCFCIIRSSYKLFNNMFY